MSSFDRRGDDELPVARVAVPSPSSFSARRRQGGGDSKTETNSGSRGDSSDDVRGNGTPTPTTTALLGSPDARRASKLETGVLDLSVRELQDNDLHGVAQLVDVCSVHSLGLARNALTQLCVALPSRLVVLDVSHNRLESLAGRGLQQLTSLQTLIASHNRLQTMDGLETCVSLQTLDLSHNEIQAVNALPQHRDLYSLDLSCNNIKSLDDVRMLAHMHMQVLHLHGNPIHATHGTGYRLILSHMLPTVRCLDDVLQAPSPYINRDSLSGSPARRIEAHENATGTTESVSSLARTYWAKKPNKVQVSSKKSLSYLTIHKRRAAAASAATTKVLAAGKTQTDGTAMRTPQAKQRQNSDTAERDRAPETTESPRAPRSYVSRLSPPGKVSSRISPRRDQVSHGFASGSARSPRSGTDRGKSGRRDRRGDEAVEVVSVAQQMSEARLHERRASSPVYNGGGARGGGGAAVRIPTVAPESSVKEETRPHAPSASTLRNSSTSSSPGYAELLEDEMDQARARSRSGSSTGSRRGRSSARKGNNKNIEEQVKAKKVVSRDALERLSRTPTRMKRDKASKRPGRIETAFGRTYDKDDRYALNAALTPHTYDFASRLRDSGKKKSSPSRGETARAVRGGQAAASVGGGKQRSMKSERNTTTPGKPSAKTRGTPSKRNTSSTSRMRSRTPTEGSRSGFSGGPTPANTPNIPRVRVSLPEAKPVAPDVEAEDGEEEWNDLLRSLIDQKRKSLALLYRSLSNETESQSRLVNSQKPGGDIADVVQSIHIDRQGQVSYN